MADLDAEIVTGDMRDEASMRALRGVRYLLHVAADYRLWAPDPDEIERANLEGAVATMRAARGRRRADRLYEQRRDAEGDERRRSVR